MSAIQMQPLYQSSEDTDSSLPAPKVDAGIVENAGGGGFATHADAVAARLSKPHRDYLLERHGTLDLDPVPSMDAADPYNWPTWKVGGSWCFTTCTDFRVRNFST